MKLFLSQLSEGDVFVLPTEYIFKKNLIDLMGDIEVEVTGRNENDK